MLISLYREAIESQVNLHFIHDDNLLTILDYIDKFDDIIMSC